MQVVLLGDHWNVIQVPHEHVLLADNGSVLGESDVRVIREDEKLDLLVRNLGDDRLEVGES